MHCSQRSLQSASKLVREVNNFIQTLQQIPLPRSNSQETTLQLKTNQDLMCPRQGVLKTRKCAPEEKKNGYGWFCQKCCKNHFDQRVEEVSGNLTNMTFNFLHFLLKFLSLLIVISEFAIMAESKISFSLVVCKYIYLKNGVIRICTIKESSVNCCCCFLWSWKLHKPVSSVGRNELPLFHSLLVHHLLSGTSEGIR